MLVAPKDKDTTMQKSGVIYWFKCIQEDCEEEYISQSGRTFGDRLKEHLRTHTPFTNLVYRTSYQFAQLFPCRHRSSGSYKDHQGDHVHKSQ